MMMQSSSSNRNLRVNGFPARWRLPSADDAVDQEEEPVVMYGETDAPAPILRRFGNIAIDSRRIERVERESPARWVTPAPTTTTLQLITCPFIRVPEDEVCAICMETNFNTPSQTWSYAHGRNSHCFHTDCIQRWAGIRPTCPVCRVQLSQ